MMNSAPTVTQYLASLPADRRAAIAEVRDVVNANLPKGYAEGMQYGMICWYVPFSRVAETYNGQPLCYAGLASQKNHMALYLMGVYGNKDVERSFRKGFADAGKKLDMGKSCVRFKQLEALPLDVIGETIASLSIDRFIDLYQSKRPAAKRTVTKRGSPKRGASNRTLKIAAKVSRSRSPKRR